jgi:flagellar biosynthesis/type III secretory pathway chaperone
MTVTDSIKDILAEQITAYSMLQSLLQQEKICLVNVNHSEIEDCSKEKDTILIRLRLLEDERKRLLKKYSLQKGLTEEATLNMLSQDTGDDAFAAMRLQIISLLQNITELNEFNRILIDRSVSFFRNALGFLDSAGFDTNHAQKVRIISREV